MNVNGSFRNVSTDLFVVVVHAKLALKIVAARVLVKKLAGEVGLSGGPCVGFLVMFFKPVVWIWNPNFAVFLAFIYLFKKKELI